MPRIPNMFQCGECKEIRKEGNHWWMSLQDSFGGFEIKMFDVEKYLGWEADETIVIDCYCSEGHLFEAIRKWIQNINKK